MRYQSNRKAGDRKEKLKERNGKESLIFNTLISLFYLKLVLGKTEFYELGAVSQFILIQILSESS